MKRRFTTTFLLLTVITAGTLLAAKSDRRYFITDLDPADTGSSQPTAINNAGEIVGTSSIGAFLYRDGVMTSLQSLVVNNPSGVTIVNPTAINRQGVIVGTCMPVNPPGSPSEGFVLSNGTLTTFAPGSSEENASPCSINTPGTVVGNWYDNSEFSFPARAFIYAQGTVNNFEPRSADSTQAVGINDAGQIAGTLVKVISWDQPLIDTWAFLYENGKPHLLGTIPGFTGSSTAAAINARGDVVGTIDSTTRDHTRGTRAFLYSKGKMINLGLPTSGISSGTSIAAVALNNRGQVVGNLSNNGKGPPFVYQDGKIENLQDLISKNLGWQLYQVTGINDSGVIIGYGRNRANQIHAFMLTPLPTVKISGPARIVTTRDHIVLRGTARGNSTYIRTCYGHHNYDRHSVGKAVGTAHWHANFALARGANYLNVNAVVGEVTSLTATVVVIRK